MKILSIECSASPASAAVVTDGKVISSFYVNIGLHHSSTLMPLIESALKNAEISIDEIDAVAVSKGPGSFTGIRIGLATLKGLCFKDDKPAIGVSTLEAMAYNSVSDGIVCSLMDARCSQFYTAFFERKDGCIIRLTEDSAISSEELFASFKKYGEKRITLVGDGARLCYNTMKDSAVNLYLMPENALYQNAVSVALCAENSIKSEGTVSAKQLNPSYLRVPQAERELKKRR